MSNEPEPSSNGKRVLVVGGGSIGERHVRCFLNTGRAIVSLCEINADVRGRLQSQYDLDRLFSSFDDAVNGECDGAVICTPAHLHVPMAQQLAERGVGLLIEKPLSTSTDGVDDLLARIERSSLVASVAYVTRHHPVVVEMKRAIDASQFGRIVQVIYSGGQHFPLYRPAYRDIYYNNRSTGGGAIQDALTHSVNAAEWLVGPVTKLIADAQHCVLEGVDVEDTVNMLTRHGDVMGSFSLNQHQPVNQASLTVIGTDGMARFESHTNRWLSCEEAGADWKVEAEFQLERDDLFVRQANAFLDQLDGRAEPACSIREGLQTLKVNLSALRSAAEGRWVQTNEAVVDRDSAVIRQA